MSAKSLEKPPFPLFTCTSTVEHQDSGTFSKRIPSTRTVGLFIIRAHIVYRSSFPTTYLSFIIPNIREERDSLSM